MDEKLSKKDKTNLTAKEKYEKKLSDYLIQHTIGKGTFGEVKIGIHIPTRENVAIKIFEKNKITDTDDKIRFEREMKICKSLQHLNVVKIFEVKNI